MKKDELKNKLVEAVSDYIEKARGHKYIRREGTSGNYTYIYKEPDGSETSSKDPERAETSSSSSSASSPREEASKEFKDELKTNEYDFARESKISNMGEDIIESARHKRNRYKDLTEAEAAGEGADFVTVDNLLKANPIDLFSGLEKNKNPLVQLEIYHTMQKAPDCPDLSKFRVKLTEEEQKTVREGYVEVFNELKSKLEELSADPTLRDADLGGAHRQINKVTVDLVNGLYNKKTMVRLYLYNAFAKYHNSLANSKTHSPIAKVFDFKKHTTGLDQEEITDKVKTILEGKKVKLDGVEKKEKKKEFDPAYLYVDKNTERQGPTYDLDTIKKQEAYLLEKAKMRGIQWGNSVTDDEREHHLNNISYAFKDLTEVLGLPEEMGSFNGKLALAVGARGRKSALAHYEPSMQVINLTRKNGVGSLAHEWGHFFDNINLKLISERGTSDYLSEYAEFPSRSNIPEEIKDFYNKYNTLSNALDSICDKSRKYTIENGFSFKKRLYWNSKLEVFARCFENHVSHKLRENGRENTYLTQGVDHPLWPDKEESKKLAPLFDAVFDAFKKSPYLTKSFIDAI